ncbi:MAG TPA: type II toxin-antitoxin system VapC family toxin [Geminicoccaceae bacterium]|nr:type II toxin-antitoxin system VapC family toxin [Geminicoccaceae bacterium]
MKGLDTNVLLRMITADDPEQIARVRRYLRQERHHAPFWINRIVLCELVWSLATAFKFDRPRVAAVIMLLLRSDEVTIEGHRIVRDALYLFQTSNADFADCLIGLSNGLAGCERTATFDRGAARLDEFELI